jgi:hypothetical protein
VYLARTPLRVAFFARPAALGKILTMDNLKKWKIIVVDWCYMCKSRKTVNHLLLHCNIVSALWYYICSLFGLAWVMPRLVRDLLACWRRKTGNSYSEALWKMILLCLMWCMWRERNDWSFEDNERMVAKLKTLFFHTPFRWIAAYDSLHIYSFHDLSLFFFGFKCFSYILHVYLLGCALWFLMKFIYLYI